MRRDPRQPAQLVGAKAKHVVQAGIGTVELERCIQLALAAQHAGGQLVGEAAVALGEPGEVAVARIRKGRSRPDCAENLESRPSGGGCFLNPASPWWEMTASRPRAWAYDRRDRRHVPRP